MIIGMTSRAICNIACYLYPAYASYKALSLQPPTSQEATIRLQRWLMYWAVVGCWTVLESWGGWTISWIPFYSFFRCGFFLWLSLPQTEGSTIVYNTILAPTFQEHEHDIDAFLASMRSRAGGVIVGLLNLFWKKVQETLNLAVAQSGQTGSGMTGEYPPNPYDQGFAHQPLATQPQPPTLADPGSGAIQAVYSLATRYALQYLPLMASAMASPAGVQPQPGQARMEMPIPQPTPHARRPSAPAQAPQPYEVPESYAGRRPSDQRQRVSSTSRSIYPSVSSSLPSSLSTHPRSVSTPTARMGKLSASSSEEELSGRPRSSWGGASGYEEIRREELDGQVDGNERPPAGRGGSWFGWGSGGGYAPVSPRDKAE